MNNEHEKNDESRKKTENNEGKNIEIFFKKINDFNEMGLKKELLQGIYKYGFEKPSEIQQRGILPLIQKTDLIAQAQSGTGKTATFVIGTLQNILIEKSHPQILVIAPTRELVFQIQNVYESIGKILKINAQSFVGGTKLKSDITNLSINKPHIIIGTPGRLLDLFSLRSSISQYLQFLIIDEADEMFSRGFKLQVYRILKYIPKNCKIAFFSATLPKEIMEIIEILIDNPIKILVKKEELTLEGIKQFYIPIDKEEWKLEALFDVFKSIKVEQSIIYANSKKKVEWLSNCLEKENFPVAYLHGDLEQLKRSETMKEFRSGNIRFLITTDLLSRGIDIQKVNFVINFDLPLNKESYIHRIGRSGRFGKKGVAINFLSRLDIDILREIEGYYNTTIELIPNNFSDFEFIINS
jgi:superfamily II DNA/RNA helicase